MKVFCFLPNAVLTSIRKAALDAALTWAFISYISILDIAEFQTKRVMDQAGIDANRSVSDKHD